MSGDDVPSLPEPTTSSARGAAFFDLDRTLIRRSSMLALAPSLRRHGLIGWGSLARASVWHAVYLIRGVSSNQLAQAADQTFRLMRGWPVAEFRDLIAEEIEPLAQRLGLDGALASRAETRDGRYTGRVETFLHGAAKRTRCARTPGRTASTWPNRARTPTRAPTCSCSRRSGTRTP